MSIFCYRTATGPSTGSGQALWRNGRRARLKIEWGNPPSRFESGEGHLSPAGRRPAGPAGLYPFRGPGSGVYRYPPCATSSSAWRSAWRSPPSSASAPSSAGPLPSSRAWWSRRRLRPARPAHLKSSRRLYGGHAARRPGPQGGQGHPDAAGRLHALRPGSSWSRPDPLQHRHPPVPERRTSTRPCRTSRRASPGTGSRAECWGRCGTAARTSPAPGRCSTRP